MCDVSFILSILLPIYQAKVIINLCTIDIIKKAIIGEKSIGISIYLNKTSLIGPTSGSVNILNIS